MASATATHHQLLLTYRYPDNRTLMVTVSGSSETYSVACIRFRIPHHKKTHPSFAPLTGGHLAEAIVHAHNCYHRATSDKAESARRCAAAIVQYEEN